MTTGHTSHNTLATAPPITDKATMYRLLSAGSLGNTIPQFFSLAEWEPHSRSYPLWGIRSLIGGGDRRMRLNVPTADVPAVYFPGANVSPMIDAFAVIRGEVIDSALTGGISLRYVPPDAVIDPRDPWRGSFRNFGRNVSGSAAVAVLKAYLWPDDYEAMRELLGEYPDHAVEFTACDRPVGVVPMRNCVIWECRQY